MPHLPGFRHTLPAVALGIAAIALTPLAAQQAAPGASPTPGPTPTPTPTATAAPTPTGPINLVVSRPRGEVNKAQQEQCRREGEAGTISGEIVVCAETTKDDERALTGTRAETQKRYAQETMNKGKPPAPDLFGIPDNGKGIGFGKAPPPAITVDFAALPTAPAGSDADRIARGLAPLGQEEELTEEQERARREAAGITTTTPPRPAGKKKKGR
ncbi:hypothetical protein [Erythrobacter sp. WG]|uniref:hypothetical protein n=1 Tax=Erythrobacter sp. WG TaxID=2985510 RepID=UPI0022701F73|nr:hypothetical protein [Erythrobacter sp. WG]MCX9145934.1 hypothetical protein [Erythrobacter sp. WG]